MTYSLGKVPGEVDPAAMAAHMGIGEAKVNPCRTLTARQAMGVDPKMAAAPAPAPNTPSL